MVHMLAVIIEASMAFEELTKVKEPYESGDSRGLTNCGEHTG